MKNFLLVVFFAAFPTSVFAHAFPVAYEPEGFSAHQTMPSEVVIHFSQEITTTSHGIDIFAPDGSKLPHVPPAVNAREQRTLSRPLSFSGDGVYVVSWRGVSAEDGHFTKGAFSFFVGSLNITPEFYGGARAGASSKQNSWFSRLNIYSLLDEGLWSRTKKDGERVVTMNDLGQEEDLLRVSARDGKGAPITGSLPLILLDNKKEGIGPLVIPAKERDLGQYDIPLALFTPHGQWRVAITFTQKDSYDINAMFDINYPIDIVDARMKSEKARRSAEILLTAFVLGVSVLIFVLVRAKKKKA